MDIDPTGVDDGHSPSALELLPILPIVLVVAWGVLSFGQYSWVTTRTAVAFSVASAALIGLPALFWALDHGHRRLVPLLLLGTLVGVTPLLIVVLSGVVGSAGRGGLDFALYLLATGAPLPGLGVMRWSAFVRAELSAAVIGAVSTAIYWVAFLAPKMLGRHRSP